MLIICKLSQYALQYETVVLQGVIMSYVSIRLPEEFINDAKDFAEKDYRTIPQQIMYWASLGKKQELRHWQLEKMRLGLQQAQDEIFATENDVLRVLNKCKTVK